MTTKTWEYTFRIQRRDGSELTPEDAAEINAMFFSELALHYKDMLSVGAVFKPVDGDPTTMVMGALGVKDMEDAFDVQDWG